jgi:hypothetical protein
MLDLRLGVKYSESFIKAVDILDCIESSSCA